MRKVKTSLARVVRRLKSWSRRDWLLRVGAPAIGLIIFIQLCYPADRMLPFTRVDGVSVAGMTRTAAAQLLNQAYDTHSIAIYMGDDKKPVTSPTLKSAGIKVDNTPRIERMNYPWYMRLIPTSLLWAGLKTPPVPAPAFGDNFDAYVEATIMQKCREDPVNASLKAAEDKLVVVPSKRGGQCEKKDVLASMKKVAPVADRETSIRVARKAIAPAVDDDQAAAKAKELNERLKDGIGVTVNDTVKVALAKDALSWLDITVKDDQLVATVSLERAARWLDATVAPAVVVKPGTSYITTKDFTETSRQDGAAGQALDIAGTVARIQEVVDGVLARATVVTKAVPPLEQYTRTYSASDAGLTALMTNYAKDHPGTFGISMVELDGKKRRAEYNGTKQFVTASTYKLFVAYSLMKQIDAGKRDWDSSAACFNKMISQSDNACAESFLTSLGLANVTKDIYAIGLKDSNFTKSGGPYTTANDLVLLTGMIATGQNFSSANQQRLIGAMKGNVYRNGIPAGASGTVADKVGFMGGLLHDAAIVYGPNGTYVLAIMTDGSSWATIADFTRQLDTLHAQ